MKLSKCVVACPCLLLFCLAGVHTKGQYFVPAASSGMGGATVALYTSDAVYGNPAGLSKSGGSSFGVDYSSLYGLPALSSKAVGGLVALAGKGALGITYLHYGYTLFNQSSTAVSYARIFSGMLSAGIKLNYLVTKTAEYYAVQRVFSGTFGVIARLNDNLSVGTVVLNMPRTAIKDMLPGTLFPSCMRMGIAYTYKNHFVLCVQAEKESTGPPCFSMGIEYRTGKICFLRAGVTTGENPLSFGLGFPVKKICIDVASSYHQVLGFTQIISMRWELKKTKDIVQ